MPPQTTVTDNILLDQRQSPDATGRFTILLNAIVLAGKIIASEVNQAGLVDVLGFTGDINVQGEEVKKLDEFANNVLIRRGERSGTLCAMASEENADIIEISHEFPLGDYILIFDPLDGSSNIDANINIGTIFSIFKRKSPSGRPPRRSDILQPGCEQVAAGYILYGTSTMLVYTTGNGVHGFTLDPSVGEFLLSHPNIKIPEQGGCFYSINEGYWHYWDEATREIDMYFKSPENHMEQPYSLRYIGSLVADFHRTLLYGGIFLYPPDMRDPKKPKGKLRLMSECNPLAMLCEQAGGMATDGVNRLLDMKPKELHQRVPFFAGSQKDVEAVRDIYLKHDPSLKK